MKISVCMATFNGGHYVKQQLQSILIQLNDMDEVIISDDLSTDDTLQIIKGINDKRIKLYVNNRNLGYSKNFENAISKAIGDIIFISDQDDVWVADKVAIMVTALKDADMVISDAEIVDTDLTQIHPSHFEANGTKKGFTINFLKTRYIGACMAFNKKILTKALPFPQNSKMCAYDYWLAIIAEYYYSVALINLPLIKYRRHGKNASQGGGISRSSFTKKVAVRGYSLVELLKRKNQ